MRTNLRDADVVFAIILDVCVIKTAFHAVFRFQGKLCSCKTIMLELRPRRVLLIFTATSFCLQVHTSMRVKWCNCLIFGLCTLMSVPLSALTRSSFRQAQKANSVGDGRIGIVVQERSLSSMAFRPANSNLGTSGVLSTPDFRLRQ